MSNIKGIDNWEVIHDAETLFIVTVETITHHQIYRQLVFDNLGDAIFWSQLTEGKFGKKLSFNKKHSHDSYYKYAAKGMDFYYLIHETAQVDYIGQKLVTVEKPPLT